jgi:hypothetical protein
MRSRNHCCRGKVISITCCECVFVALVIQHDKRLRHIVLQGNPSSCTRNCYMQTDGRTDGQICTLDEANSRFSLFYERGKNIFF